MNIANDFKKKIMMIPVFFLLFFNSCYTSKIPHEFESVSNDEGQNRELDTLLSDYNLFVSKRIENNLLIQMFQKNNSKDLLIICVRERVGGDYSLLDYLKISVGEYQLYPQLGVLETNGLEEIIIALEPHDNNLKIESSDIFKAWFFDCCDINKFVELNLEGLYRVNEGYYYR